jgi:hypothetical protein
MTKNSSELARLAAGLVLSAALASPLCACDVPVFRYALERWPSEPHILCVGPGADIQPGSLGNAHVNLMIEMVQTQSVRTVRALMPDAQRVWYEGAWQPDLLARLVDSPLRRRIAHELVTGQTAVWLLLEGSDAATNAAVYRRLEATLALMQREIQLPESPAYDPDAPGDTGPELASRVPLRVAFSLHRLKQSDRAEELFIRQLMALRPPGNGSAPAVFVVFGQGRVLALEDDMLTEFGIGEVGAFLCGPCSCQIKEQNPGDDLLFAANWDGAIAGYPEPVKTELPNGSFFMLGGTNPPSASSNAEPSDGSAAGQTAHSAGRTILAVTLVALLVAVAAVVRIRRRRRQTG